MNINVQMSNLENTSLDAKLDNLQIVTFLECIISFFQRGEARIEFRIVIFPRISLEKMPDCAPRQCVSVDQTKMDLALRIRTQDAGL